MPPAPNRLEGPFAQQAGPAPFRRVPQDAGWKQNREDLRCPDGRGPLAGPWTGLADDPRVCPARRPPGPRTLRAFRGRTDGSAPVRRDEVLEGEGSWIFFQATHF